MIDWILFASIVAHSPGSVFVDDDYIFVTEEAYREAVNRFEEQITDARKFAVIVYDRPDDILLEQSSAYPLPVVQTVDSKSTVGLYETRTLQTDSKSASNSKIDLLISNG